jgi:hypothetical protein
MNLSTTAPFDDALALAMDRGVLPTSLGSADARGLFRDAARERAVFSARTTNATYLQGLRERLARMMEGGYEADRGQLRLELKSLLRDLAYDPAKGFPGDEDLDIPEALPGSLRDLSSDLRLNLILDTQERLMRGKAQRERGLGRADLFPAWELVRVGSRRTPRGEAGTKSWGVRWIEANGPAPILDRETGRARLIALKTDGVWDRLGNAGFFDDALDVDHPPFAFNSGMGWRELSRREWIAAYPEWVEPMFPAGAPEIRTRAEAVEALPRVAVPAGLDADLIARLRAQATPEYRAALEGRRNAA